MQSTRMTSSAEKRTAIIGGSAMQYLFADGHVIQQREVLTHFGTAPVVVTIGHIGRREVIFLPRHGSVGNIAPHRVNYRANIQALSELGVTNIFAVNAVGGLGANMSPGTLAVPDQIIDYSYGRDSSFFDGCDSSLKHTDFTEPYSRSLRTTLLKAAEEQNIRCVDGGVYACTQGPRLETAAEIRRCIRDGCDLVGMTGMPEAVLAQELEIEYASLCLVVNWGAGLSGESISMEAIMVIAEAGARKLRAILQSAVDNFL